MPDHNDLYAALLARDPGYDGRALVGVTSTGIFCRLSCPARKPRRDNCRWFADAAAAGCVAAVQHVAVVVVVAGEDTYKITSSRNVIDDSIGERARDHVLVLVTSRDRDGVPTLAQTTAVGVWVAVKWDVSQKYDWQSWNCVGGFAGD